MSKENWVILLCIGLILMILAAPFGGRDTGSQKGEAQSGGEGDIWNGSLINGAEKDGRSQAIPTPEEGQNSDVYDDSYEKFLEKRVKEVLSNVEGVGKVDVLIVLKSSEQKVYQTDGRSSQSSTKEQDVSGGVRDVTEQEQESSTVVMGGNSGAGTGPLLAKELRPEISGIIISAQGGGNASVKTEIMDAMEALFGLPAHKIKVLKRVE